MRRQRTGVRRVQAACVHLLTASGAALGFLALLAVEEARWRAAFLWLFASLLVDGADGWLARRVRVKEVLPWFDGHLVDYVVDYLTYVVIPALLAYRAGLLPDGLGLPAAIFILLVSTYTYGNLDAKTEDSYFLSFPGLWNFVVFYLFILGLSPWINLGIVALFGVLSFVPVCFVHPFRVQDLPRLTRAMAALLIAVDGVILFQLPDPSPWLVAVSLIPLAFYAGLGLWRTFRPPAPDLAEGARVHGGS